MNVAVRVSVNQSNNVAVRAYGENPTNYQVAVRISLSQNVTVRPALPS